MTPADGRDRRGARPAQPERPGDDGHPDRPGAPAPDQLPLARQRDRDAAEHQRTAEVRHQVANGDHRAEPVRAGVTGPRRRSCRSPSSAAAYAATMRALPAGSLTATRIGAALERGRHRRQVAQVHVVAPAFPYHRGGARSAPRQRQQHEVRHGLVDGHVPSTARSPSASRARSSWVRAQQPA